MVLHLGYMDEIDSAGVMADIDFDGLTVRVDVFDRCSIEVQNFHGIDKIRVDSHLVIGWIWEKDDFASIFVGYLNLNPNFFATAKGIISDNRIGVVLFWNDGDAIGSVTRRPKVVVGTRSVERERMPIFDNGVLVAMKVG